MNRIAILLGSVSACALQACATPQAPSDACAATRAVLGPLVNAALEQGLAVEIETRAALVPPSSDREAWRAVADSGFAPAWRDPAADDALRRAYWRAWAGLTPGERRDSRSADRRAWETAYAQIGDDRLYADEAVWDAFLTVNRGSARFACAAAFDRPGITIVSPDAPRPPNAVRVTPARPGFSDGKALIAAHAVYPPFEAGDPPRDTGTVWLLDESASGWRVISARNLAQTRP